jgi:hypothetical protein
MNAEGGIGKQIKKVSKDTYKATTNDQALKSYAIAGLSAGLTFGLTQSLNLATATQATSTSAASPGIIAAGNQVGATLGQRITTAFAESAISTFTSSAAQSAVNGDSFSNSFKGQLRNVAIGAVGNLAAKGIGRARHGSQMNEVNQDAWQNDNSHFEQVAGMSASESQAAVNATGIGKPLQLVLHAGLGCGMAAAGGNDCASGAVAGMVGEEFGSYAYNNMNMDRNTAIQLGGLAAGLSTIFTGNAVGLDDQEVADNIFAGQRIGANAVANNAVAFRLEPSSDPRNPYGHMSGYFQDKNGQWYKYDQGMAAEDRIIAAKKGIFPDTAYKADVSIVTQDADQNVLTQRLINHPNVVFIRTTPEQDQKITDAAHWSELNPGAYRICTNNCVDAVQNIFSAGNVKYPIDFHPAPSSYFEKLKTYYPNNQTNESYDK